MVKASHPSSAPVLRRIQYNGQRVNEQLNSRWPKSWVSDSTCYLRKLKLPFPSWKGSCCVVHAMVSGVVVAKPG